MQTIFSGRLATMPRGARRFALAAALAVTAGAAFAHDYKAGDLAVGHPWSRATPAGAQVAGGFMTIENKGMADDRLVGAASEIAGRVEVHEMAVQDGVMKMRQLEKGLVVPPGQKVELKPGGLHIMFMDLKRQLKQGESFKAELQFEKAGRVPVEFKVDSIGAKGAQDGGHGHGHGHGG